MAARARKSAVPAAPADHRVAFLAAGGIVVLCLAMLWWIWGRGCDVLVDFGRTVYVPWQLSEGQTLYKDIAYLHGPLSAYAGAMWFRAFGASVASMAISNLLVLACLLWLIYDVLASLTKRWVALVGVVWFVLVFAFADYNQHGGIGNNFNYIYPYAAEATHGLTLSFAALALFRRWIESDRRWRAAATGVCLGCVFLTKPEFFLALASALAVGLIGSLRLPSTVRSRTPGRIALLLGAAVAPLLAWGLLSLAMPGRDALRGTLGGFAYIFDRGVASSTFYREVMGTSDVPRRLTNIGLWLIVWLLALGPAAALALMVRQTGKAWLPLAAMIAVLSAIGLYYRHDVMTQSMLPLPLAMAVALAVSLWRFSRPEIQPPIARVLLFECVFLVFALVLLLKILFNTMAIWYGFTLALPATLMLLVWLLDRVPAWIERRGGTAWVFQAVAAAPLVVFVAACLELNQIEFTSKTAQVGSGANAVWTYPYYGEPLQAVLAQLAHAPAEQTLLVMPEGALLNLMTKRRNPSPYINFNPFEVEVFGEAEMLAALEADAPNFVVFAPQIAKEFGLSGMGFDYGQKLTQWMIAHYGQMKLPPTDSKYPIILGRRYRQLPAER